MLNISLTEHLKSRAIKAHLVVYFYLNHVSLSSRWNYSIIHCELDLWIAYYKLSSKKWRKKKILLLIVVLPFCLTRCWQCITTYSLMDLKIFGNIQENCMMSVQFSGTWGIAFHIIWLPQTRNFFFTYKKYALSTCKRVGLSFHLESRFLPEYNPKRSSTYHGTSWWCLL